MPTTKDGKPGEVVRISELPWGVDAMAFSPDGQWLAMGRRDLILHDLVKNQRLELKEDLDPLRLVKCCRFTPTGSHLLVGGQSGMIMVFEVSKDGHLTMSDQYVGHNQEVQCLAISDDGKFALSGGEDKLLHYWKIDGGEQITTFTGFDGAVKSCQFLGGRSAIATDGRILLQANLGKESVDRRLEMGRTWFSMAAEVSPDGDFVAVSSGNDLFRWNIKDSAAMPKLEDSDIQWSLVFTPDGERLLTGADGKINVWDVRKGTKLHSLLMATDVHNVNCVAVSADGMYCAASSAGRDVQVFLLPARRR
jgi:hypothetical protein